MIFVLSLCVLVVGSLAEMPLPFSRELAYETPQMTGNDVIIYQNLIIRDDAVTPFESTGVYDKTTESATIAFQSAHDITATGIMDDATAALLLDLHSADNVKDSGFTAASMGYMYKIFVPVYTNRSVESSATLYDAYNNVVMTFPVRAHGRIDETYTGDYGDVGLNQFTSNGNTVTGLVELDLNSPEPDPASYGPWPVNRIVRGLEGNSQFMLPYIRDGQLIHTGNWTSSGWTPTKPMPNSAGCIHSHPEHVERIYKALVRLGVTINDNTFSGKEYPYKPQGIGVIQLVV